MAAVPFLVVGLSGLAMWSANEVLVLTPEHREVISLLEVLRTDPEHRLALETYLAGQHGALLRNTSFWKSQVMQAGDYPELRRIASDIATRYPSVTAEELARSRETIRPILDRVRPPQSLGVDSSGVIVVNLIAAMGSLFVLFCSIVSSIAVPGGLATRMIGLAVVTSDGNEIGRGRSLARTLIAWAPILPWLLLVPNPIVMGFGPPSPVPELAIGLAFGTMIAGVVWTIAAANRGLQDRIAGTWVVPR